jgi:hypothetical protein
MPTHPALTSPLPFDTFNVRINRSQDSNQSLIVFNHTPINFNCSYDQYAHSFFYGMGGDSVRLYNPSNQTYLNKKSFILFQNKKLMPKSYFTLFDITNQTDGPEWQWIFIPSKSDTILEGRMDLSVYAYDLKTIENQNRRILSNINNGFGYFGALNRLKKSVYVVIRTKINS